MSSPYPAHMGQVDPKMQYMWPYMMNATIVDLLPKDMLHMIDDFWYQFPPINPLWHNILGMMMIILGIIGVTGNGMVIYLTSSVKNLWTPTNMLICNLAFSDFLMMAYMTPVMSWNCFSTTWVLGPFQCEIYGMWGSAVACISIWSLVFISLDRYNVIVKGVTAKPLTFKKASLQLLFVWAWSVIWTLLPMFGWGRYVPEGNMTSCQIDVFTTTMKGKLYAIFYPLAVYWIPFLTMVYAYFFIVKAVVTHEKTLREQARKMNVASLRGNVDSNKQSAEFRIAKVAMITVSLWFIAWTPYLLLFYSGTYWNGMYLTPLSTIWGAVFAKASTCYNPIVYAITHPRYKAALYAKFPSMACTAATDSDSKSDAKSEMSVSTEMSDKSEKSVEA